MKIREITEDILIKLGVNPATKGFGYICTAMELFEQDSELKLSTGILYEKLAEINSDTSTKTERAIRHCFESITLNGNSELIEKYLSTSTKKNSALLNILYIRAKREMERVVNEKKTNIS